MVHLPANTEEKAGTAQPGVQTSRGSAMSLVSHNIRSVRGMTLLRFCLFHHF